MKVLLVDDHLMFRLGIRSVIEQQGDIDVVGEAASYLEAISMIERTQPDVTVLDLRMPGAGGIAVLDEAKRRGFSTKFLILSSYASEEEIYQALGMDWIPPELREGRDEVKQARRGSLPELVTRDDIRVCVAFAIEQESEEGRAAYGLASRRYTFLARHFILGSVICGMNV